MENLKTIIISIILFTLLGFLVYWAYSTLETGSTYLSNSQIKELKEKNQKLENEIFSLKKEVDELKLITEEDLDSEVQKNKEEIVTPVSEIKVAKVITFLYQTNINELQKLFNDNIYLKKGDSGSRVGVIQRFLNIYNKSSSRVDNDYGKTTILLVSQFQKDQKIFNDGEVGPSTTKKMIEWLKKF